MQDKKRHFKAFFFQENKKQHTLQMVVNVALNLFEIFSYC